MSQLLRYADMMRGGKGRRVAANAALKLCPQHSTTTTTMPKPKSMLKHSSPTKRSAARASDYSLSDGEIVESRQVSLTPGSAPASACSFDMSMSMSEGEIHESRRCSVSSPLVLEKNSNEARVEVDESSNVPPSAVDPNAIAQMQAFAAFHWNVLQLEPPPLRLAVGGVHYLNGMVVKRRFIVEPKLAVALTKWCAGENSRWALSLDRICSHV